MNKVILADQAPDVEAWVAKMIAQNGYAQLSVHDQSTGEPGFAFTIGLEHSRRVPELFCMGVAPDIASQLFSLCIDGHDAKLCDLSAGHQDVTGLIDDHVLRFRLVQPAITLKANAIRPNSTDTIGKMVQLLLPDNNGYFPGDPKCDLEIATAQDPDRLLVHSMM